ncbi:amino acid adenylation domain-containing protein [Actinoplanes sp. KI2]|uniref:non-ribosomal peptide synthetase n=1 Tax=Actinoplanes sp. KI2 TaxID=2983315 RepID=UPI0021D5BE10|nr:amino acid adenylation domain-containing protein [Actinoplanes sp. KI2]MCU7725968.1 amino acid adenylation domain-containing protein [Actinoplanes sp. KI2]
MPGKGLIAIAQQWMWLLEQLQLGGSAMHLAAATEISGALDVPRLRRAVQAVADRHEPLRTAFHEIDGELSAAVRDVATPLWETTEADSLDAALEWARTLAERTFDLGRAETMRAGVARIGDGHYLLVLVVHHIVADGFSINVIYDDLTAAYAGLCDETWTAAPLPMTFADHVESERDQAAGNQWAKNIAYWRAALDGAPPQLSIPTDHSRPARPGRRAHVATATLAGPALTAVRASARDSRVSLTMLLAAAWAATLYRHGGGSDLVIGMPFSGRDRAETQRLVGPLMNVLPVRIQVDGEDSFDQLLKQARRALLGALQNRQVPLTRLVAELQPERSLAVTPFFQTMLNHATARTLELDGLDTSSVPIDIPYVETDLTLTVSESEDQQALRFEVRCNADLFDEPTAPRWLSRFRTLLSAAVTDRSEPVSRLPLLDRAERQLLERLAAAPPTPPPSAAGVVDLIAATTLRSPDAIAVRAGSTTLTYAQLNVLSDRLASAFRASGAKAGSVVALHLDRSWKMLAAMLGVWKAGGAYLPIDPLYPRQRTEYVLIDAEACLIVTDVADLADELNVPALPVLRIGDIMAASEPGGWCPSASESDGWCPSASESDGWCPSASAPQPPSPPPAERAATAPEDPAYLIYTSGSTGNPKGVVVPHRAVVNFLASMARAPGCAADDVVLALTSPSFDIAVLELFLPLTVGGTVVIASAEDAVDPHRLAALIASAGVTVMQATPVTWKQLVASGEPVRLRLALCGGEQLTRGLANQLLTVAEQAWNMYGPTETTVWSLITPLSRSDSTVVPIGRPIDNTTVWVLDDNLRECPLGVPGELCIGGAGVALGYHGLPAMTEERFVTGPRGERVYRTGDVARLNAGGEFVMLGRRDNQVKVNGHRIELDEISSVLRRHELVADAITVVRHDDPDTPRLVSYVIARR